MQTQILALPDEVAAVFREFRSCEFTTIAKDGTPISWPTIPLYQPAKGNFLITTSIGLPQKAYNIRRNPHVSLFFSNPTGSGLDSPAAVLVQGNAQAPDEVVISPKGSEAYWEMLAKRQPSAQNYSSPLMRRFTDWYYMRILITITPVQILWWPRADFNQSARIIKTEVNHVG